MKCDAHAVKFCLAQDANFTLAACNAQSMAPCGEIVRAPDVHAATM